MIPSITLYRHHGQSPSPSTSRELCCSNNRSPKHENIPQQDGTRIYAVTSQGLEAILPGDAHRSSAIDSAMGLAQKKVEEAGRSQEAVRLAKENTELILKGMLAALGWTANIRWK